MINRERERERETERERERVDIKHTQCSVDVISIAMAADERKIGRLGWREPFRFIFMLKLK